MRSTHCYRLLPVSLAATRVEESGPFIFPFRSITERVQIALVCISAIAPRHLSLKNKHVFVAKGKEEGNLVFIVLLMWQNYFLKTYFEIAQ